MTAEELRVVGDAEDALILARIKRMSPRRLKTFDRFVPAGPADYRAFTAAQVEWLKGQQYLLGTRLGRSPTHAEVVEDFERCWNGLRFRAYYTMKFPQRMARRTTGK